jgi:hypothetical protein
VAEESGEAAAGEEHDLLTRAKGSVVNLADETGEGPGGVDRVQRKAFGSGGG